MPDVRAGRAFIEMYLKDERLSRDMRAARRRTVRMATAVTGVATAFAAIGAAAGVTAAAGIIKATNAAGDFAETVSKFQTVFGDMSDDVREWADTTAAAVGATRREILGALSNFQDLFVPLGIEGGQAAEMSQQLTQLAVDLASFNNLRTADVIRDLASAMTGSSETMKKYGVIVDAAAVKQELLNRGLDPKEATNAEKAMARLELIMRSTTAAQGDAVRTAGSWNNQLKQLRTSWEELQVEVGQKFLPVLKDALQIINIGLQSLIDNVDNLVPAFEGISDQIVDLARQGNWELVGEIIGKQITLGLRKSIGPELASIWDIGLGMQRRTEEWISLIGRSLDANAQLFGGGLISGAQARTAEMEQSLKQLIERADRQLAETEKQTKEQQETTRAVENQEGALFQ